MNQTTPGASIGSDVVQVRPAQPSIVAQITKGAISFARRKPVGAFCFVILLIFVFAAAFGPDLAPHGSNQQFSGHALEAPDARFWMGTDDLGRDVFTRILYGARISITVGFVSVALGIGGGTVLGLVSGFRGGTFDLLIQRFVDGWQAFPSLILLLCLVSALGPSLLNVCLAIGIGGIPGTSRVVRGTVLAAKENDYILAARSIGAPESRILARHILPNIMAPIIILASVRLGGAILAEASLSFLGLGVPPPNPTWGGMISNEGRTYMLVDPWLAIWPGLMITAVVMSFNLFGDALRDVWDPRLRGSH